MRPMKWERRRVAGSTGTRLGQLGAEAAERLHIFRLFSSLLTPVAMSEGRDGEDDVLGECWITSWEQQTVQELEREPDHQEHLQGETDAAAEKLWSLFQSAAQCVAVMYKGEERPWL